MAGDAGLLSRDQGSALESTHRLVFVGGLHRSGTTLLARCLAAHPDVSGFEDTGAPEDEGQHLQDVYPPAADFGGPGRFAFHREAHLTERSALVLQGARERLLEQWLPHWRLDRPVLLEKSPPNLIRLRFLRALFPESIAVVVVRHPLAVSYATQKWSGTSLSSLLRHWLTAHRLFAADRRVLGEAVHVVFFEDFVARPEVVLADLERALRLAPGASPAEVRADANEPYFERWERRRGRRDAAGHVLLGLRFEHAVGRFGYSLRDVRSRGEARTFA